MLGKRGLASAALVAAIAANSPIVRLKNAPKCDRCGQLMVRTKRAEGGEDFWVCGNGNCGVAAPLPPKTRAERRRAIREDQKRAKRR